MNDMVEVTSMNELTYIDMVVDCIDSTCLIRFPLSNVFDTDDVANIFFQLKTVLQNQSDIRFKIYDYTSEKTNEKDLIHRYTVRNVNGLFYVKHEQFHTIDTFVLVELNHVLSMIRKEVETQITFSKLMNILH